MPLARARVITVLPNQASSFKFFTVGKTIGAIRTDRTHGVWGTLATRAPLVPITVTTGHATYQFRTIRHPLLLPLLSGYLSQVSHQVQGSSAGPQTVSMRISMSYEGVDDAVLEETYASTEAMENAVAMIAAVVGYLEGSPFAAPELTKISISLVAHQGLEEIKLVDATPDRYKLAPGETVTVRARLLPRRGTAFTENVRLQLPQGLPSGPLDLIVAAGDSWSEYDVRMRGYRPSSFADEVGLVRSLKPSSRLVVALEDADTGVTLVGGWVATPPSIMLSLRSGLGTGVSATSYRVVALTEHELDTRITGAVRVPLVVSRDGESEESAAKGPAEVS